MFKKTSVVLLIFFTFLIFSENKNHSIIKIADDAANKFNNLVNQKNEYENSAMQSFSSGNSILYNSYKTQSLAIDIKIKKLKNDTVSELNNIIKSGLSFKLVQESFKDVYKFSEKVIIQDAVWQSGNCSSVTLIVIAEKKEYTDSDFQKLELNFINSYGDVGFKKSANMGNNFSNTKINNQVIFSLVVPIQELKNISHILI